MPRALVLVLVSAVLTACSTTHGVRPIGKGAVSVDLSVGGPITEVFDLPIPLPLSTLGATYGLTDTTDLHAAWHPTAALMTGIFAADLGASQQLLAYQGARPRLMGDLTLVFAGGDTADGGAEGGFRLFGQPSLTASWDWGRYRRSTVFTGLTAFLQPFPEFHVLGGAYLGNRWALGKRLHVDTELTWLAPYENAEDVVPVYYAPASYGAISLQFGLGYTIGGAR